MKVKAADAPGVSHTRKVSDFAAGVEGVTYGIQDGIPWDTGAIAWKPEDKVRWAEGNARFYTLLGINLQRWADAQKKLYAKTNNPD